jgi:hypothetical protein
MAIYLPSRVNNVNDITIQLVDQKSVHPHFFVTAALKLLPAELNDATMDDLCLKP